MLRLTETRLRRAFTAILATTAGAAALGGCGGAANVDGGGGGPTPEFTSLCGENGPRSLPSGLNASPPIDGAVTRTETAFPRIFTTTQPGSVAPSPEEVGDAWQGSSAEPVGTLCGTAGDRSACLAKVAGYRILPTTRAACKAEYGAQVYSERDCGASYILYTRGDEVGVARTQEEIKALIGSVDTIEEALWITGNAGYGAGCNASGGSGSEYRTTGDGGWDLRVVTTDGCGLVLTRAVVHVDYRGELTVLSTKDVSDGARCSAGRRPEGLRLDLGRDARDDANTVGHYFAEMATLEAASVIAFRRLHRQLAAHGAPRELLARIRKAAHDEIRHARATTMLAKKYGVTPSAPCIAPCHESPSLFAIALENAGEGCVRETYGALVAQLQVTRAGDADVRTTMAAIAEEETEHAALSWDIAAWIESQLDEGDRAKLATRRRAVFTTLLRELSEGVDLDVQHVSGVPGAREALRMLEGLAPVVLAAA